jgi:hypothetical protein
LLGHGSIETTERYTHVTHVTPAAMGRIRSPLDALGLSDEAKPAPKGGTTR